MYYISRPENQDNENWKASGFDGEFVVQQLQFGNFELLHVHFNGSGKIFGKVNILGSFMVD